MSQFIESVVLVKGESTYFADDQEAIRRGTPRDGFVYVGDPVSPGFSVIREPGAALIVMLFLSRGEFVTGDCVVVQYSGAGGRERPLSAEAGQALFDRHVAPHLVGRPITGFRELSEGMRALHLPSWLEYGVSQALLRAVALVQRCTPAAVIRHEWSLPAVASRIPVFAQSGEAVRDAVDRMVLKRVDALPHGLINNVETRLGAGGEKLRDLVRWIRDRIQRLAPDDDYRPTLHFDVYGTLGLAFHSTRTIADYICTLEDAAHPYPLRLEHPVDAGSRDAQILALAELRQTLRQLGSSATLVADEWCNTLDDIRLFADAGSVDMIHIKTPDLGGLDQTVDAVGLCREYGVDAYCGGTCNETVGSAQLCTHVAMASGADLILAKPGMGVDEGLSIVRNEMRTIAAAVSRTKAHETTTFANP
jgi:methylaspartate ammonia-lyase